MKRITKEIKAIADKHLEAKKLGLFDDPFVTTREEVLNQLKSGKTFSEVLNQIEIRFVTITSLALSRVLDHETIAYKKSVYKGFNTLLNN